MITKKELHDFIEQWNKFDDGIHRMEEAISGNPYGCNLVESDWYTAVDQMLNIFLNTHFTDAGVDWIIYFMFELVEDKRAWVQKEADMFNEESEIEYSLNTFDELWDFLITYKKEYFKNVE